MAKSKFDMSLLKPIEEINAGFETQLKPVNEEDHGEYLDNLPEPEGFWHKLPRNILAGLANLGHSTLNLPHDLVQGVENAGESFGNSINKAFPLPKEIQEKLDLMPKHKQFKLSEHIPMQEEHDFANLLGQKGEGTLMDKIIQKGVEYAPEIASGRALIKTGLRKFPVTQKGAARQLKEAEKLVNQRGVNNFQMSYPLLQETAPFLPKTHATGEMIQGVINGEYKPAFALQSQIGQHARNLAKSPLASERLLAPQARELKQLILHEMEQALRGTGHHEIADLLKGGIEDYAKYMKFREKALPVLKKLGIPSTGLALLGLGTNKGKKLATKLLE